MGFAVWIDKEAGVAWAQGTHEYRPMGTAVVSRQDQFRPKDFRQTRRRPAHLEHSFAGFFGSLEEVNVTLRDRGRWRLVWTPAHLR
jgi:NAD/NADP transhydrogenase alpha subunit